MLLKVYDSSNVVEPVYLGSNDAVDEVALTAEDRFGITGLCSFPLRPRNDVASGFGARCACPDVTEVVGEHVDQLHRVVAIFDLGNGDHDRLGSEIQPSKGIHRVVVGTNDVLELRTKKLRLVCKLVERGAIPRRGPVDGLDIHRPIVLHHRKRVDVGLFRDGGRLLGRHRLRPGLRRGCRPVFGAPRCDEEGGRCHDR